MQRLDDDAENVDHDLDDGRDYVNPGNCHAIIPSTGKQCTANVDDYGLCGTHESARNVTRVDDVKGAPFADLRDRLVEAGLHGPHAYRFATKYRNASDLWHAVTGLEPITIGDHTYDVDGLATHAETIARLDEIDASNHPFSEDRCIALTYSDKSDGRCTNGSYGTGLLCGTHQSANDPDTIYDPGERGPAFRRINPGEDEPPIYFVEDRDDDVVVIDGSDWSVQRIDGENDPARKYHDQDENTHVEQAEDDDMNEATVDQDETDDEHDDPDDWIDPFVIENRKTTLEDAGLSGREAEVAACKSEGFTHEAIAEYLDMSKSTVDEYSRRARKKLEKARSLVDELGELYD